MLVLAQDQTGFRAGFENSLQDVAELLPKIGYFLLILIVGAILAKVLSKVLTKVLQRVGFDDLVERGGVKKAMAKSKYDAAGILGKIVYYFIFLLVLSAAFGVFGPDNPVSAFLREIIAFLPNIFVAVLVIVIAAAVAAAIKDVVGNLLGGLSYGEALANALSLFVIALGVFFALDQLQIAPMIVGGIFYALVALIVAPLIIAFGVGGIDPARDIIQDMRSKASEKADEVKQEAQQQQDGDDGAAPVTTRRVKATSTRAATTRTRRRPTA
jgi:archaellum component FlaG (FlaF/FlaG flagellin family)